MTTRDDLWALFESERSYIEQAIELGEHFKEVRKAQSDKGIDWSRAKVLFKAIILDERDGGHRAADLEEKADMTSEYAEYMRGATIVNDKSFSSAGPSVGSGGESAAETGQALAAGSNNSDESEGIPPFLRRVV